MPYKGSTSVFRTSDMSTIEIWKIGEREVALPQNKPLLGRADIVAALITKNGLNVIPQEPPKRHANIIDWPEEKSKQKQIALELAAEAKLHKKL